VPEAEVREALIAPSAGLLGVNLRRLYRELSRVAAVHRRRAGVPLGGRIDKGSGASGKSVTDAAAKTLLTLDRLRKLHHRRTSTSRASRNSCIPSRPSMAMLQDLKKTDELVKRLEQRPKAHRPPGPARGHAGGSGLPSGPPVRIGEQLGEEVVRMMFEQPAGGPPPAAGAQAPAARAWSRRCTA
jgi:hypothetical protein